MRNSKIFLVLLTCAFAACGDGTLVVDDSVSDESPSSNNTSTTTTGATDGSTQASPDNGSTTTPTNSGTTGSTNNLTVSETTGPNQTVGPTNGSTTGDPEFHPMFVAVADFMRVKCVSCHDQGQNGNLIVPSADVSNAELRMNLEGVVATTGRMLIEPNDPAQSQVYIMITNSAGEQFPPETIAIVENWINAGAPYDP